MQPVKKKNSSYFFFSFIAHVFILGVLVMSMNFSTTTPVVENARNNTDVINAKVLDSSVMKVPAPKLKVVQRQPQPPIPEPKPIDPSPIKPVLPKVMVKSQEPPPLKVVQKQTIAIDDKKLKKQQQEKIEQQLLADLAIQKKQMQKKPVAKNQLDKEKIQKQKALADAFQKEIKQLAEKSLQQQMQQEQNALAAAHARQVQGQVDKYKALILQSISQNWLVPANIDKKLYAELLIRVAPGGVILDVQLIKTSGNDALDRSARAAVLKSSPLPVPADPDAFEPFRQFTLKVKPENILTSDSWMG